ncbi:ROK family protein [Novosphingobium bradum]|uniref:ROK family protein n=1 Tax=Novosphingobium bradum TaxID=1737444 RepID=A0ABV7IPB2_9SPHN
MRHDAQTLNRLAVLKAIRRSAPVSRGELARLTGLGGATITEITGGLMTMGLLEEHRVKASGRGRPRSELVINARAGVALAAHIVPGGEFVATFVDLGGEILHSFSRPMIALSSLAELARIVAGLLDDAIVQSGLPRDRIMRVALSLPAIVDRQRGIVRFFPPLPMGEVPVAAIISRRLGLPVTVENDLDCFARAHHWFGEMPVDDFVLVHVGQAVGMAMFTDGVVASGADGLNAELGHVKTDFSDKARPCICGGRGCLLTMASMFAIVDRMPDAREPLDVAGFLAAVQTDFEELADRALAGDAGAKARFDRAGEHLGIALANLVAILDPGLLLLQTPDQRFADLLRPPLMDALDRHVLSVFRHRGKVQIDQVMTGWRWKGAAALALEQIYLGAEAGPERAAGTA